MATRSAAPGGTTPQPLAETSGLAAFAFKTRNAPPLPASIREKRGARRVDLIGLEPSAGNPEKQAESAIGPSAVVAPVVTFETDCPDLVALAKLWKGLPPVMRGAVRGMAEAVIKAPFAPRASSPT